MPEARGYSREAVDDVLGLVFLAGYIVGVISLAAGITFAVIRIFPTERNPKKATADKPDAAAKNGGDVPGGNLFRRSKRGK